MRGVQGNKWERLCHLKFELKFDLTNKKMGEKMVVGSLVMKHSHQTKVEMTMVKAEKATVKEACKAKKLVKLAATIELSSTKNLPKTPKGEREEASRLLNPKSGEGGASIGKESSKGEASKNNVQVVEQF